MTVTNNTGGSQNLQQVTDIGAITTLTIEAGGFKSQYIYNSSGDEVFNTDTRKLINYSNVATLDFEATQLINSSNSPTVDWNIHMLYGNGFIETLDWNNLLFKGYNWHFEQDAYFDGWIYVNNEVHFYDITNLGYGYISHDDLTFYFQDYLGNTCGIYADSVYGNTLISSPSIVANTQSSSPVYYATVNGSATNPTFSRGTDLNTGMYFVASDTLGFTTGGTKRLEISTTTITSSLSFTISAQNIITDTTTGTKIGTATTQKIGLWNATPIVQPTTSVGSATLASPGGGTNIKTDDTFDGYSIAKVVKALRNIGILA